MNTDYQQPIPDEWGSVSKMFAALGDEHRQRILLLFDRGEGLSVGQIADASELSRAAVSHHVKVLEQAKVLTSQKVGREVYFWVNKAFLVESLGGVLRHVSDHL